MAKKLGHRTHESGRFRAKIAALKQYGLIVGKSINFNISPLGEDIFNAPENEFNIRRAISNVKLFVDLYEETGDIVSRSRIKKALTKITKSEVKDWVINEIMRPYKEAIPYLQKIKEEEKPLGKLEIIDLGHVKIVDKSTFEIALKYMEILGKKFKVDLSLDPIQKILLSLLSGSKSFSQLMELTGLSENNLSLLLQILQKVEFIKIMEKIDHEKGIYHITNKGKDILLILLQR